MNFGPARPLTAADVTLIAGYLGCHIAAVRAVLAVESAGKGFGPDKRPIILNEPHVFYRELSGAARDRAVREGLAYQTWGAKPYPKTQSERYAWLARAMAINETAALRSCSWGLGQVMGFNHKAAGYATVQQFVQSMMVSEGAHLYAMARFIVANGLQKHLRNLNWAGFARGYNGAGYAKNRYDTKLAAAYAQRPASERVTPPPTTEGQLNALATGQVAPEVPRPVPPTPTKPPSAVKDGAEGGIWALILGGLAAAGTWLAENPLIALPVVVALGVGGFMTWRWWRRRNAPEPEEIVPTEPPGRPLDDGGFAAELAVTTNFIEQAKAELAAVKPEPVSEDSSK